MAWVTLDDDFPNHPKAQQAGRLAAYMFVCGLCYCRKYHTGGFIPSQTVRTFGERKLAETLILVGLWETADGGIRVHDYHQMYPDDPGDKAKKDERRKQKQEAGRKGGLKTWARYAEALTEAPAKAETEQSASSTAKALNGVGTVPESDLVLQKEEKVNDPPLVEWFAELKAAYPTQAVSSGYGTESAFAAAVLSRGTPHVTFTVMLANLVTQKRGAQWLSGKIPRLDRWLSGGLWEQRHDAPTVTDKTAGTLAAAAEILRGDS